LSSIIGEIAFLAGDEAVPDASFQHEPGEIRHRLLAADFRGDALFRASPDLPPGGLGQGRQQLLNGFALGVQAKDVLGLDGVKGRAAAGEAEALVLEDFSVARLRGGHIRVDFDDVGMVFFRQLFGALHQVLNGLPVVQVRHRAPAGVHHGKGHAGDDFPNQHRHAALDFAVPVAGDNGLPFPHGLLLGPQDALGEVALGMGLDKGFIFRNLLGRDDF
jgi:hypothetical protein